MPRPNKAGGAVQGKVGAAKSNRTDLQGSVPVAVAPSQQYGERAQQQAAQRTVPVGVSPMPSPTPTPTAAPAPGGQPMPGAPPQRPAAAFPSPPPGGPGVLPWQHPTNRPNEPVTTGLPTGPGAGPEALSGHAAIAANGAAEQGTVKNLLSSLASQPFSSSAIRDLAAVAGAGT